MKIAFISIAYESLAISILSAIAKKEGHDVRLIHIPTIFKDGLTREFKKLAKLFSNDKQIFEQLKVYQPDLIAFSVATFDYQRALHYAKKFKMICPKTKIVFGGIHVSCVPEVVIANNFIDYIVIGEGEIAFSSIIKHIEKGDSSEPIVNTWYKSKNNTIIKGKQIGFIQDLDSLPHFDKEIWKEVSPLKSYYMTMTSRGCPFNCSYCFNHFFRNIPDEKSNYVRRRSVKHVMEELTIAKEKYNISMIEFWDDIFIFDKVWLKEFLDAYKKEISLPFKCYIHVNLFNEDIAIQLKNAGCRWVDFGIQHINEEYRKKYLKRNETNANIINALKILKKHKIVSFADYIMDLPGNTVEHYEEARLFFIENMPDIIEPYWMSYHPQTEIIEKGVEHDILNDEKMNLIKVGLCHRGYFESSMPTQDFHNQYYFILKVLPAVPVFLRKKLTYNVSKKITYFIKLPIFIYSILYLGFIHKSPRIKLFFALYSKLMIWILKLKFIPHKYVGKI
ncbi:MAG: B12-binding domain-containing radical SAM protein [Syntrophaceae bacterium]|nr:B12-binding domain-containing radical SAM protein [Syntrophaceae bacterium]